MQLVIRVPDAEPWPIDPDNSLSDAIRAEARTVAADADARHLEHGTDAERETLRLQVITEATDALREPGDRYTDPLGAVWELRA